MKPLFTTILAKYTYFRVIGQIKYHLDIHVAQKQLFTQKI